MKKVAKEAEESILERLPPELWGEIGKRLKTRLDLVRFRSTCNSWRSNLPPASDLFPLRIPSPPGNPIDDRRYHFVITERTGYLHLPGKNPVRIVVFESIGSSLYSLIPFYENAPYGTFQKVMAFLDMQQCSVNSLFTGHFISIVSSNKRRNLVVGPWAGPNILVDKILLISYDNIAKIPLRVNPNYTGKKDEIDLIVVALMSSGEVNFLSTQLMEWKSITSSKFDDIINYEANLWVVDKYGSAYVMDFKSVTMRQVVRPPKGFNFVGGRMRLVEASGELYMLAPNLVLDHHKSSNEIKIFQLKGSRWVQVKGIGKHVFYVMSSFSFSIIVDRKGRGNCILLDRMSFCRFISSRGFIYRDHPLFPQMCDHDTGFGVYDIENEIEDKFKILDYEDLPHIFC
ncbi:F-box protein SKIP23-like [Silene latifolia]|uniref:F-box protein SKIP23-like n=1 Tax=Silene latifolia TaxID=37657 RepID=UPI003D7816E3